MYILVNCVASVSALYVVRTFNWDFGVTGSARGLVQALVAGLGSIALFRTKLFTAAYRGESHAWGPSRLLEQLLEISDREVDRRQAEQRSLTIRRLMVDLSFVKASRVLPAHALGLLENASDEAQKRLAADVKALIDDTDMDNAAKVKMLGIAVIRLTGPTLLDQAVNDVLESIRGEETAKNVTDDGSLLRDSIAGLKPSVEQTPVPSGTESGGAEVRAAQAEGQPVTESNPRGEVVI
jgi:hypothetical protein